MIDSIFQGIRVFFQPEDLTIQFVNHAGSWVYEVDMEQATSSADLLNFILQVNRKKWATPEVIKSFLDTIEEACKFRFSNNAQGVFCPMGCEMYPSWGQSK